MGISVHYLQDFSWRTEIMEMSFMPGIVDFPQVVQDALQRFGDLFANQPQRRHLGEYLTGLFVAQRKTVLGIHGEFAHAADQSCLNRFLTEVAWDVVAVNQRRLDILQEDASTRYHEQGVIPIDNVLIDHDGKLIEDAGWFWDHAEQRHKIAHDYIFANYVCSSGKHYPLDFKRFRKEDQCQERQEPFVNHTHLTMQLIDWVCGRDIPGTFTWDSYFSNAEIMNYVHGKRDGRGQPRGYVGDLKFNRKVEWKGKIVKVAELAGQVAVGDRKELRRGNKRQWYFTVTVRIPGVDHKVRIVMLWKQRQDGEAGKVLVTNRIQWEVTRIVRVYRDRWTGTETFHRDGKQQLGMGDCQLRDGQGQTRHMYLVMLAYSLLMRQLRQGRAQDWALCRLMTIGEACRAMLRETLRATLSWAIDQVTDKSQKPEHVFMCLGLD
jgi:DDE superfamily endonuclease